MGCILVFLHSRHMYPHALEVTTHVFASELCHSWAKHNLQPKTTISNIPKTMNCSHEACLVQAPYEHNPLPKPYNGHVTSHVDCDILGREPTPLKSQQTPQFTFRGYLRVKSNLVSTPCHAIYNQNIQGSFGHKFF